MPTTNPTPFTTGSCPRPRAAVMATVRSALTTRTAPSNTAANRLPMLSRGTLFQVRDELRTIRATPQEIRDATEHALRDGVPHPGTHVVQQLWTLV